MVDLDDRFRIEELVFVFSGLGWVVVWQDAFCGRIFVVLDLVNCQHLGLTLGIFNRLINKFIFLLSAKYVKCEQCGNPKVSESSVCKDT